VLPGALETAGTHNAGSDMRVGVAQGVANNLVNPSIITFYLAVVPSFLNGTPMVSTRYALFATIHVTMAFAYHSTWACGLHAMRTLWARPVARRVLETFTGLALLALAGKVSGWV
jgi:threonine/homoserine/homoserine lactone efflux protein